MTTSDEEFRQDFFGTCGDKPVGEDITGPAVISIPAPPASNQNIFAHVNMTLKVNACFNVHCSVCFRYDFWNILLCIYVGFLLHKGHAVKHDCGMVMIAVDVHRESEEDTVPAPLEKATETAQEQELTQQKNKNWNSTRTRLKQGSEAPVAGPVEDKSVSDSHKDMKTDEAGEMVGEGTRHKICKTPKPQIWEI